MKRLATLVASGLIAGLPAVASARPNFFFGIRFPWLFPVPVIVAPPVVVPPAPVVVTPVPVPVPAPVVITYAPAPVYSYVYTYPGPRYIYYYHYGPVRPYRYWR
jgi:hypothetical protein